MPTGTESQDAVLRSALPKTTGQAKFVSDISIPGTLHGHVVRSPYAHARIRHIDVTAARGNRRVLRPWSRPPKSRG